MKTLFRYKIPALSWISLVLVLLVACKSDAAKEKEAASSELSQMLAGDNSDWPKPDSYVESIPVYNTFADLEPIFHFDNDTTYIINFWATWCKPCIQELPYFEEYNRELREENVEVILVSLDFPKQLESKLVPFIRKQQLKAKVVVLLDGKYNNWIDKVSPNWSGALPATYIYKGARNYLVAVPFENIEELKAVVKPFL